MVGNAVASYDVVLCQNQDQNVQLFLAVLQIILTFIVGILTSVRMRAKCPCGGEISSKPASAPYSPGSAAGTPVSLATAAARGMINDSKEDLLRPNNVSSSAPKKPSPLSTTEIVIDNNAAAAAYRSPDMNPPPQACNV